MIIELLEPELGPMGRHAKAPDGWGADPNTPSHYLQEESLAFASRRLLERIHQERLRSFVFRRKGKRT